MKAGDKVRVVEHADIDSAPVDEIGQTGVVRQYIRPELVLVDLDGGRLDGGRSLLYGESQLEVVEE